VTKLFVRPEPYDGRLLGWELSFANYAMTQVVNAGTQHALVTLYPYTDKPCILFSTVSKATALVIAFYDVTDSVSWHTVARDRYYQLIDDWRYYCRAYVAAELFSKPKPHYVCLNSAATVSAAEELEKHWCSEFPALADIDEALGSSLVASCLKRDAFTG